MSETRNKVKKIASRNEMSSSSSSTSSFSSGEDSDNDGDLKPIKDYLLDRREVAKQLFKSVKAEKIKMMLPQVLKKVEFAELEEWCASELCGMSKKRILSILNGMPMSDSSDTSDSDDSGPSLEIISDTEEWLTDEGPSVKKEPQSPSSKTKVNLRHKSRNDRNKNNSNKSSKHNKRKMRNQQNTEAIKIKKEGDKSEGKNQEGESLLDLLELEMRARAIRALIRKEEDIIPNIETDQGKSNEGSKLNSTSTIKYDKSNETSETLVEKIGEDEDVVLLIKPTPTIELISSDSENENSAERVNKKLESERAPERGEPTMDKTINDNTSRGMERQKDESNDSKSNDDIQPSKSYEKECNEMKETVSDKDTCKNVSKRTNDDVKANLSHEDKLTEYEEIIDLDDYPDDMDDIDNEESSNIVHTRKVSPAKCSKDNEESIETWATRYYQTDSVQNVIKESKIQSEIRKRLRERQRLSKLNNSPKEATAPATTAQTVALNDNDELKPTGSVDEYLALKSTTINNLSPSANDENGKQDDEQNQQQPLPSIPSVSGLQANDKLHVAPD